MLVKKNKITLNSLLKTCSALLRTWAFEFFINFITEIDNITHFQMDVRFIRRQPYLLNLR